MIVSFTLAAALIAMTALGGILADRLGVPRAILLVALGIVLAFVPLFPKVSIDPDIVLLVMLPPLLYEAGVGLSWRGFRSNLRPILLLAIGCVVFTATAVAAAVHWWLGLPWAVAFVLGAAVSPPDPVAPMAIARTLNVPKSLLTILEGEGLVNDATALILLSFAIAAVTTGSFSLAAASASFVAILVGETLWGLAVAAAMLRLRKWVREPQAEIILALLTPYLAFWPPHELGGSGVLAAVVAGLYVSWNGRRMIAPGTRLQGYFVWGVLVHLIEGVLFLLVGLQARAITAGLDAAGWARLIVAGVVVSVLVIVLRFVWVFPSAYGSYWIARAVGRPRDPPAWQATFFIGFTGLRGAVSLAGALTVPVIVAGSAFPERQAILFVTFFVIVVTLFGQGLALPRVIRWLGLDKIGEANAEEARGRELRARIAGVQAALTAIDALALEAASPRAIASLQRRYTDRMKELIGTVDTRVPGNPLAEEAALQRRLIEAERQRIMLAYDEGDLTDEARRRIERELDLEEARRRTHESATRETVGVDPSPGTV